MGKKAAFIFTIVLFLLVLSISGASAANWYVSNTGTGTSTSACANFGNSWATAWSNTNQINWSCVNPGDTIWIDGGTTGKSYNSFGTISKSGSAGLPITIARSNEAGRNGNVTFSVPILISGSYIVIDGGIWHGFIFNLNTASYTTTVPSGASVVVTGNNNVLRNVLFNGYYAASTGHSLGLTTTSGTTLIQYADFYQSVYEDQFVIQVSGNGAPTFIFDHCVFRDNNKPNRQDTAHRDVTNPWTGSGGWNLIVNNSIFFNTPGHASDQPQGDELLLQVGYPSGSGTPLNDVILTNNVVYNTARFVAFGSGNTGVNNFVLQHNTVRNVINGDNLGVTGAGYTSTNNLGNNAAANNYLNPTNPLGPDGVPFTVDDGFNLVSGAVAVNGGSGTSVPYDIRGNLRTGNPDLGAYEYTAPAVCTNCRYVRAGATGNGNGTDWTNAYTNLPNPLIRGYTYFIADGSYGAVSGTVYGSYEFDDSVSGVQNITIKKAINDSRCVALGKNQIDCYGTLTGWQDTYGDGQAIFSGSFLIATDYIVIDGQTRNENNWSDGNSYGFRINQIISNTGWSNDIGVGYVCGSNLNVRYVNLGGPDIGNVLTGNEPSNAFYIGGFNEICTDWTISRNYVHNVGVQGAALHLNGGNRGLVEYNWISNSFGKEAIRGQNTLSNYVIRNNVFKDSCQNDGHVGSGCTAEIAIWDGSNFDNHQIYGNIFWKTTNEINTGGVMVIGGNGGGFVGPGSSNSVAYQNTFIGFNTGQANVYLNGANTNCRNNLWYNVIGTPSCGATTSSNNIEVASNPFVNLAGGNLHLASATTPGASLSSPYDKDMDGKTRGNDGVWDIGAYEYDSGGPSPINGVCSSTINTCTSGTLNNIADNSTHYLWQCTGLNGGTTASCSSPIPPLQNVANGSIISVNSFGAYTFNLTQSGTYKLVATVNNPSDTTGAFNSFYIDIDTILGTTQGGVDDIKSFDFDYPIASFSKRDVSWRGNVYLTCFTYDCPEFKPKNWTLASGVHTLYVAQRESAIEQIQSFQFIRLEAGSQSVLYHPADNNPQNLALSPGEVGVYMNSYFSGSVSLTQALYALTLVQQGGSYRNTSISTGCSTSPWTCWTSN